MGADESMLATRSTLCRAQLATMAAAIKVRVQISIKLNIVSDFVSITFVVVKPNVVHFSADVVCRHSASRLSLVQVCIVVYRRIGLSLELTM